jgi:hypothetical protein
VNTRPVGNGAERRRRGAHLGNRDRPLPQEPVIPQALIQLLNLECNAGDLIDGIVAPFRRGAVATAAFNFHPDFHPAPMTAIDVQVCRLGNDDEFRLELLFVEQVLPAQAVAVLFHDRAGEIDRELVIQAQLLDDLARIDHRGHAALLIHSAAAPDLAVFDSRLEGIEAPLLAVAGIDGVNVGVEGNDARPLANPPDNAAQTVHANLVEPDLLHLLLDDLDHLLLFGGKGRRADKVREEANGILFERFGSLLNGFVGRVHSESSG